MTRKQQSGRTPWSIAIRAVLADGEWHDREELMAVGKKAVPPGIAYRRAERHRKASAKYYNYRSDERKWGDEHTVVAAGSNRVANDTLRSLVATGVLERDANKYRMAHFDRDGGSGPVPGQDGGSEPPPE